MGIYKCHVIGCTFGGMRLPHAGKRIIFLIILVKSSQNTPKNAHKMLKLALNTISHKKKKLVLFLFSFQFLVLLEGSPLRLLTLLLCRSRLHLFLLLRPPQLPQADVEEGVEEVETKLAQKYHSGQIHRGSGSLSPSCSSPSPTTQTEK